LWLLGSPFGRKRLKIKTILKRPLLITAEIMVVDAAAVTIDEDEVMN
jgi:hypothetical protein